MAVALHHSRIYLQSSAAEPTDLHAFLDRRLLATHTERNVSTERAAKRRKVSARHAVSTAPGTVEETVAINTIAAQNSPLSDKSAASTEQSPSRAEDDTKWMTLAKVDIYLEFEGQCESDADSSPSSEEDNNEDLVTLERFHITNGKCSCQIATQEQHTIFRGALGLKPAPDQQSLAIIDQAILLSRYKQDVAKSTYTLSKAKPTGATPNQLVFKLCLRILVKDFQTMGDSIAFVQRGRILDICLPEDLQPKKELFSPRDFYDNVYMPDKGVAADLPPVRELQCQLLPFQRRAIGWLLQREGFSGRNERSASDEELPHGFIRAVDADGRSCFLSRFLGVVTTDRNLVGQLEPNLTGGILAEEMGLGKTVEIISLICLHRRPSPFGSNQLVNSLPSSPATLIIAPPALLQQWKEEIQTLAPTLKVSIYNGVKAEAHKSDHEQLIQRFLNHDIILTTFLVLSKEIHYAESTDRPLRHEKRYEKRLSPLIGVHWWRVVLDEAQMLESGVSSAAKVANIIPRENAWCVSGTPVKKDPNDIFGLLLFLRHQPYCSTPKFWSRLITEHRDTFKQVINRLALRHTKEQIKDEIEIPAQKRVAITVPFSHIEEQHYSTMFQEMAQDCGLDVNGGPLTDDWDPDAASVVEKMRNWLTRLRQTCLHPEVGARNRKALGGKGPLRTVSEVLEVMIEQNHTAARTEERILLMSQLRRGQILEHAECTQEALDIWVTTLKEVEIVVQECREQLKAETLRVKDTAPLAKAPKPDEEGEETSSRLGPYRLRLRAALEYEHTCVFFTANAYYQLKTKEEKACIKRAQDSSPKSKDLPPEAAMPEALNKDGEAKAASNPGNDALAVDDGTEQTAPPKEPEIPKSDKYKTLEQLEETAYERAKSLRKEILSEARKKADWPMKKIKERKDSMVHVPAVKFVSSSAGGIESRNAIAKVEALVVIMQGQTMQIEEWREKTVELVTATLVDEAEQENLMDSEIVGKEYETSTKQQDESYAFIDALRALVADRHDILTGQHNLLIDFEMKRAMAEAKENKSHAPDLLRKLLERREELKPPSEAGSIRAMLTELRELKTTLRAGAERQNSRAAAEHIIVNSTMIKLQQISNEQSKVSSALEKEVELFKDAMNLRLEFYRQLQAISDSVAPYEHNLSKEDRNYALANKEEHEEYLKGRIATLKSKGRYLLHLREEAADTVSERTCIICKDPIENGILTSCGHVYCVDCLQLWWNTHRNCPTCKKHLRKQDFHQITYKPSELTMEEEAGPSAATAKKENVAEDTQGSSIYAGIREPILMQIKNIDIDGSYGTKIDTIARHVLWIREHDPGAKSIIFSQYKDFLEVLHRAFDQFKIGCTGFDRKDGIQKFKSDPGTECFFLHAKAHSSGLNLVNATHVFLCEPLINTAIELQAIARVHRIGQRNETTVWMYLVEGTVEKSIYDISVQRRLAHMGQLQLATTTREVSRDTAGGRSALEEKIEAANSLAMEDSPLSALLTKGASGGEMVPNEDLWDCLFRSKTGLRPGRVSHKVQREVARHLGAGAAEVRLTERSNRSS